METPKTKIKLSLLFGLSIILDYLTVFNNHPEVEFEIKLENYV